MCRFKKTCWSSFKMLDQIFKRIFSSSLRKGSCFVFSKKNVSVLTSQILQSQNRLPSVHRLSNYIEYRDTLDSTGVTFFMPPSKVLSRKDKIQTSRCTSFRTTRSQRVEYLSRETESRQRVIPLLLLDSDDGRSKNVIITYGLRISRRWSQNNRTKSYVCVSCLQPFSNEHLLQDRRRCCLMHKPQQTAFPDLHDSKSCKLKFRSYCQEFLVPFYLVADFECFLKPSPTHNIHGNSRIIDTHEVSAFSVHLVSRHETRKLSSKNFFLIRKKPSRKLSRLFKEVGLMTFGFLGLKQDKTINWFLRRWEIFFKNWL